MPHLRTYVGLADHSEKTLADSFRAVADGHATAGRRLPHLPHAGPDGATSTAPPRARSSERYGEDDVEEPERLHAAGLAEAREGEIGLLRDLQDLHVLATLVQTTWTVIAQGAQGLRDRELLEIATTSNAETTRQLPGSTPG